jgi:hypothetical protein
VPLEFLKKLLRPQAPLPAAVPESEPEKVNAEDYVLRLSYAGKGGEGVRMEAGSVSIDDLSTMLTEVTQAEIEIVPPRPEEFGEAVPAVTRPVEASAWIAAHRSLSPVTRHAMFVLETLGAVDPTIDTLVCALLDGTTDTSGTPDYAAMVGGIASHWDEATGDLVVRPVVGWGGAGVRGDSDRVAARLIAVITKTIKLNSHALDIPVPSQPVVPAGRTGLVCGHCGFASAHKRAFYCPKCGMRLLRG